MSHNLGGMAPYVSMPRGRNQMYYPQFPGGEPPPHMQRGPCFPEDKMNCGMMMGEFKPPMMSNPELPPPKKKRRTSNNAAANQAPPPVMQDLLPPPLTGYGDTIIASNPFDDTPPQPSINMNHMQHHGMPHHMNNRHMPCSPHMMHMSGPGPCQMGGSPINCGPPMGSPMGPMNCGPPMGGMNNCGPMNCGPGMGSPIGPNRSPLVCPSGGGMMSCGPPQSSPMNHPMNRSPSIGSPLGPVMNAMSGPSTGSPMDCGKGSPMQVVGQHGMSCNSPMGSPLANGPMGGGSCVGPPISSPMGNACSMSDMGGGVMNRSPMNGPMGSPMCGMGGPSPHMTTGPPTHMSGPSPHMGGPSPHMGGPSPHMGGPSPHMSGPSPHMSGPSPHMSGPSPHMSGPSPHMGGPSPHMGGPSPHMVGSSSHLSGPSPHMNNTNPINNSMNNMNSMSSMGNINTINPMGSGGDSMNINSAVGKGLNNGPPVSVNTGTGSTVGPPTSSNGPMRGQMINHNHSGNMMQSMHPMGMGHPHNYTGHKPMPVSAGKIYPVDQPMVFNPQNPNAPPIYPCGICHKEVHDNDQAILCESGCNFWFHRVCTGLIEAAYQLLTAEVYAEWVCDKCLASKNIPLVKFKP